MGGQKSCFYLLMLACTTAQGTYRPPTLRLETEGVTTDTIPACTPEVCFPIVYKNPPWSSAGELVAQPTCILPLGTDTIAAGNLIVDIVFDEEVNTVEQWAFTELAQWSYINEYPLYPPGNTEYSFLVHYSGTIMYHPYFAYTTPPQGNCIVTIIQ